MVCTVSTFECPRWHLSAGSPTIVCVLRRQMAAAAVLQRDRHCAEEHRAADHRLPVSVVLRAPRALAGAAAGRRLSPQRRCVAVSPAHDCCGRSGGGRVAWKQRSNRVSVKLKYERVFWNKWIRGSVCASKYELIALWSVQRKSTKVTYWLYFSVQREISSLWLHYQFYSLIYENQTSEIVSRRVEVISIHNWCDEC